MKDNELRKKVSKAVEVYYWRRKAIEEVLHTYYTPSARCKK